ncbi:CHAD domain-containing protein [Mucilaginibacter paludis]|uniref:CHAD domain-containing protein n=1 Tax=Mucilaginibacter paludis DSM 18603 TaxID=714943 RepID=H1Y654_9SPHI|nr:CHAD domain-containing protein [Mucilaginibacter paludis]EHQ31013.1 hypothetical protein Mucpa_6966 [Mucilaginibacter paludis DSM 18603]
MRHKEIESIIRKRFEKLNTAFEQVRLHFREDDIRSFRVKVKKLQACLYLMEHVKDHHHAICVPRHIADLYKLSGTIRTLQMQERCIRKTLTAKNMALPQTYLALLSGKILHAVGELAKLISNHESLGKEELNLVDLLPHHLSQGDIEKFIASKEDALKKLIAPVFPTDVALHEIRKELKNLLYTSPYIPTDIGTLSSFALLSTPAQMDSFTIILGDFHDMNVAIDCLHAECTDIEINDDEKAVLRNIETQWMNERTSIREKVYDQIQKITASILPLASPVK